MPVLFAPAVPHAYYPPAFWHLRDLELARWSFGNDLLYFYLNWVLVAAAEGDSGRWRILQDNLCPRCGQVVVVDQLAGDRDERAYRWCRELWKEAG